MPFLLIGLVLIVGGVLVFVLMRGTSSTAGATGTGGSIEARLTQFAERTKTLEEIELEAPFSDRVIKPLVNTISNFLIRFMPSQTIERTRINLLLAGSPNNMDAKAFVGVRGIVCLIMFGAGFGVQQLAHMSLFGWGGIIILVIGVLGFFMPSYWLGSKISKRKKQIVRALPDAIDLLTISVEAGLGFDTALARVSDKWDNPLSMEFRRVIAEQRVGKARRDALRELVVRTGVTDLSTFVASIIQADQLGVSMAKVLRIQSEQMRLRRRQLAEETAHKAPIKMIFPMVFLIFPALYIVILGPAVPILVGNFFH